MHLFKTKHFNNQNGFSLIQVLVLAGVIVLISLVLVTYFKGLQQSQRMLTLKTSREILKLATFANLSNYESWQKTISQNAGTQGVGMTSCLGTAAVSCLNNVSTLIDVYNAAGGVVIDSKTASAGFRLSGEPCNSFVPYVAPSTTTSGWVPPGGDDDCPFHMDVQWNPSCCVGPPSTCGTANCTKPNNYVRTIYYYNPANEKSLPPFNAGASQLGWTNRLELSSDAPYVECGMESWVYIGKPLFTLVMPNGGSWTSDIRGCVSAAAFRGPPGS